MNIPKKLDLKLDTNQPGFSLSAFGQQKVIDKLNELIDYLQAKEEASKCICPENSWRSDCPYPHTNTGKPLEETSKKDEFIKAHNKALDYMLEAISEASKGEGKRVVMCNECMPPKPMNDHKYLKGVIIHERTDCPPDTLYMVNENLFDKPTPPQHEEEWENDFDNLNYYHRPHPDFVVKAYIRDNFVSKEKIKREFKKTIEVLTTHKDRTQSDSEFWTAGHKYALEDCIYWVESLLKSLGLGD